MLVQFISPHYIKPLHMVCYFSVICVASTMFISSNSLPYAKLDVVPLQDGLNYDSDPLWCPLHCFTITSPGAITKEFVKFMEYHLHSDVDLVPPIPPPKPKNRHAHLLPLLHHLIISLLLVHLLHNPLALFHKLPLFSLPTTSLPFLFHRFWSISFPWQIVFNDAKRGRNIFSSANRSSFISFMALPL